MHNSKIFILSVAVIVFSQIPIFVYGDGFAHEVLPPASVGDREASLFIKISPPILTNDTVDDKFLELRLFDAKIGTTIKHTSFFVTVDKNGELLMRDLFHTHSGNMTIKIQSASVNVNDVIVYGDQEPFQGGWTAVNDQITIKAPILLDAGLYHFKIEIFGIDNDKNIFIPSDAPKFDSWLSVGDIFNQTVSGNGQSYNVSVTSYYDKINNFSYDNSTKSLSFSMPFNWEPSRLEKQNIFVHEEVHVPTSFKEFSETASYKASVNGFPITGKMLIADPYSTENTLILHFLLNKENILDIAKTQNSETKTMEFSLSPGVGEFIDKNSFDIKFDSGASVKVQHESNLVTGKKTPFEVTFFDKDGKLLKNVRYGYRIDDIQGTSIFESQNPDPNAFGTLVTEGIDNPEFEFNSPGKYKITVIFVSYGGDNLQTYFGESSALFEVGTDTSNHTGTMVIPSWIKNNAGWWADGKIGDQEFLKNIEYLLDIKIMKIPSISEKSTLGLNEIPKWIKNNAALWADNKIEDIDFVQGIQFLIKEGIIKIRP